MSKKVTSIILALGLVGCVSTQKETLSSPIELSEIQIKEIKSSVRAVLKDPDSARFGTIMGAKEPNDQIFACGYINAKNSFGGFTGERLFISASTSDGFLTFKIANDKNSTWAVQKTCHDKNIKI